MKYLSNCWIINNKFHNITMSKHCNEIKIIYDIEKSPKILYFYI